MLLAVGHSLPPSPRRPTVTFQESDRRLHHGWRNVGNRVRCEAPSACRGAFIGTGFDVVGAVALVVRRHLDAEGACPDPTQRLKIVVVGELLGEARIATRRTALLRRAKQARQSRTV